MPARLTDTHPDIEKLQIELNRAMSSAQKFRLLNDLIVTGRRLSLSGLRARFPEASPEEHDGLSDNADNDESPLDRV